MCGRFTQHFSWDDLVRLYRLTDPPRNLEPHYNLAPTQPALALRFNPNTRARSLDALRWGLVPHWAKDLSVGAKMINARAEGIADKPSFGMAFAKRRCLIPAGGFYEWQKTAGGKQPFAIVPTDGPVFSFAGLWEGWRDKAAGEDAPCWDR
jgi:putative SOS response-associated peptidase YedK